MGIIQQNSRISFHTISATGSTFSVPSQEDFTSKSSPWTANDLCLSEIGVNEGDGKAYIRIGSDIKEFEFVGGTAGGESLSQTLAVGNTTGPIDIILDTDQVIKSPSGLNTFGVSQTGNDTIALNASSGATTSSSITLYQNGEVIYNNNSINEIKSGNVLQTTTTGTYSISTITGFANTSSIMVEAKIIGNIAATYVGFCAKLLACFSVDNLGAVSQISTTDIIVKENTGAPIGADILTDGTDILIQVYGDTSTINWTCRYEYSVSV